MKKIELLSPAGDFSCLKSAVNNGADAVYLSGKAYGARKFANNFSMEELKEAVTYCHLYGVKVYITINTLIYESEVSSFLEYVSYLYEINVDAVIMQDIGMIDLVHQTFPNLEIHASTQMHNHNSEGIKLLEDLGVKRIVLDRELSIDEIKRIDTSLEKEVFIHGALCVSYSGECLFSSVLLNRSGNRGECAGICRLPFSLYKNDDKIDTNGDYLLSMKELNSISNLKSILDSGVSSLKIEGRMKNKEYVGYVTRIYRKLIDKYYNNEELVVTDLEIKKLKSLYNREFTKGFINNEQKDDIVNIKTPNHQGIYLGDVLEVGKKIKIKLCEDLHQEDGIRLPNNEGMYANFIYNDKGLLINKALKGDIIYLDNKVGLTKKGKVLKTIDSLLNDEINNYKEKKIPVDFNVEARLGEQLKISIMDDNNCITKLGDFIEKSLNINTSTDDIKEKLEKLGNTPFKLNNINFNIDDNIFIPLKELNNLRRDLVEELINKRISVRDNKIKREYKLKDYDGNKTYSYNFLVSNEEQLKYLLDKNVNIYTDDILLYKKYKNDNLYYRTSRVNNILGDINNENIVCSEYGSVNKYSFNNNVFSDIYLNVANSYSVNLLHSLGVKKVSLSSEIKDDELKRLMSNLGDKSNVEIYVYGSLELMLLKYCPIKKNDKCGLCSDNNYYLKMDNNNKYPIKSKSCLVKILNNETLNNINKLDFYKNLGITNFRFDLNKESISDIDYLLRSLDI